MHLQEILVKAFKEQVWEDDLQIVNQSYRVNKSDVSSLKIQLLILPEIAKFYGLDSRMQLLEMIALFQKLDTFRRMLIAEVIKLIKLILVMLATKAVSGRLFSSVKRIKTCLHSAATNNWLNHLLISHIRKLLTDTLTLTKVTDKVLEKREGRKSKFDSVRHYIL